MAFDFDSAFVGVKDPRVEGRCLHPLKNILFIAFCTLLSNGEDYEDMVEFAHQRQDWLGSILDLSSGIPSSDTFGRVLQAIEPEELNKCLIEDGQGLIDSVKGKLISLDGKKLRGVSPKSKGNQGMYILSAWVSESRLCLGQKKVEDKSNEITAIPELLEALDLEGSTVSIDAIGCQTSIAAKIIAAKADYLLAVKKNQAHLFQALDDSFAWASYADFNETWEYDHGRYEVRNCCAVPAKDFLSPAMLEKWPALKTVVRIVAERTENGIKSIQSRYYISSSEQNCAFYNQNIRAHWSIENQLHWHLGVTFNEDANRSRKGNAPQNLNILRKVALQRIRRMSDKLSLKKRRFRASMNIDYLQKIIIA